MAIDSERKRQSAATTGRPFLRAHSSSVIDESWRIAVGLAYSGNSLTYVPPAAGDLSGLQCLLGTGK